MLGKLLKYEIKATSRTFMPLYGALLLVAFINNLLSHSSFDLGFSITAMILTGLFVALGVMTLVVLIQRFNVNLLGDEGYLMFTLPVKAHQLILSKLITTIFWSILSCIVAILTFILLVGGLNFTFLQELFTVIFTEFDVLWQTLSEMMQNEVFRQGIYMISCTLTLGLFSYIGFIFEIYLALSIAQLPLFCKHRRITSFITFFVISSILQILTVLGTSQVALHFILTPMMMIVLSLIAVIVVDILFFLAIQYLLNNHLNLE